MVPLSACESCYTVAPREGLDQVGPTIACEVCGATNPTNFVCSACSTRFPYEGIVSPRPTCPVCRSPVPEGAEQCPNCDAVLAAPSAGARSTTRRAPGARAGLEVRTAGGPSAGRAPQGRGPPAGPAGGGSVVEKTSG